MTRRILRSVVTERVARGVLTSRLRMFRAGRGLSQLKVEQRAKLSAGKYWRIENGYDEATDAQLRRIAKVLHVTFESLIDPEAESKAS